jgi:phage shock protein E
MKKSLLVLLAGLFYAQASLADPVWIDVRTAEEYAADHIDGDANIPLAELDPVALAATYGKDAELALYCRSGNRAGQALETLKAAGFTNVTNVGGISDVRTQRDLVVQRQGGPIGAGETAAPAR